MAKKFFLPILIFSFIFSMCLSAGTPAWAETDHRGQIVKASSSSALYYVASNNKRYVFPNEKIFKSWFPDFSGVVTITPEQLSAIPFAGNVFYRPGVVLVKIQTDPKIYAVARNGVLRWIRNEAAAKTLYGDHWNLLVDDLPDSFFTNYGIGDSIADSSDFDADDAVNDTDTIEDNYDLSSSNGRLARTGKCRIVSNSQSKLVRECIATSSNADDDADDTDGPSITAIKVTNGGDNGYIDVDDTIAITFNEAIDPESINNNLDKGDSVSGVSYSETGGVKVSSSGVVRIDDIATFDVGSVADAENFTVKLALNSTGKVLTVTITAGEAEITDEDFDEATQIGGTVLDTDGNEMDSDSSIADPTGTFGGDSTSNDSDSPYITAIKVSNGGDDGYIDVDDTIAITFNEAIDPESVHSSLDHGDFVSNISPSQIGGVKVSSAGLLTVNDIATFDVGSVASAENFTVELELNSTGKILTVTITAGEVEITDENFEDATQAGNVIADEDGNKMQSDSSIDDPTGTFGGSVNSGGNGGDGPYITAMRVTNGGDSGYIDVGDTIAVTFNEAIDAESVNDDLDEGDSVSGVGYSLTGGVTVFAGGAVSIEGIATFDAGSVNGSGVFTVRLALDSTGKILTITLTSGSDVEVLTADFDDTIQIGDSVTDRDGNEMESDGNVDNPRGAF